MGSSDKGEQGATHGQQHQAAVQVEDRCRRPADAQRELGTTQTHTQLGRLIIAPLHDATSDGLR